MNAVSFKKNGAIAIITLHLPPANLLTLALRQELLVCIEKAEANNNIRAILLTAEGTVFCAGADINEIETGDAYIEPILPTILNRIDASKKLCVAAVDGLALGGGMELALACDYRVGGPRARFGLPEIKLGLLPGGGGTQRLPRIAGIQASIELITSGKPIGVRKALDYHIIDQAVPADTPFLEAAIGYTQSLLDNHAPVFDYSAIPLEKNKQVNDALQTFRESLSPDAPDYQATMRCIDAIEAAYDLPFFEGLQKEAELFIEAMQTPYAKAMWHLFFAERNAGKLPDMDITRKPDKAFKVKVFKVAVIGAGNMGCGIAINFSNIGLHTMLLDMNEENVARGLQRIEQQYTRAVSKGKLSSKELNDRMRLLSGATDYQSIAAADLVIEAVFEDMAVKKVVFTELDKVCKAGAILATNTSTLDVNEIAAFTQRPADVVGLHFFNPADRMRLLEVVRGRETSDRVLVSVLNLARNIKKLPVVVNVCFGFVGNRMLEPYAREAFRMILEGASPQQVDRVLTDFGFAMGVVSMYDLVGLDVAYQARAPLTHKDKDPSYHKLMDELYWLERYGKKNGVGLYRYDDQGNKHNDPEVIEIAARLAKELDIQQREISDREIEERCLFTLINEGAQILHEKIAYRASDCDLIWVNGFGFPNWRGGPMHYANQLGLQKIYHALLKYREQLGDYGKLWFNPSPLLKELAEQQQRFI